jgi:hypothetical protein
VIRVVGVPARGGYVDRILKGKIEAAYRRGEQTWLARIGHGPYRDRSSFPK